MPDRVGIAVGFRRALIAVLLAVIPRASWGGPEARPGRPIDFDAQVLPVLTAHCARCHGEAKRNAGLDLRTKAGLFKGGDSGPALVPGSAEESLVVEKVSQGEMPPPGKGDPLSAAEVALLKGWIDAQAPAAGSPGAGSTSGPQRPHWAFRKPIRRAAPPAKDAGRVRTPVDAFILAGLEAKRLRFSPDAERATLLRRAFFDLVGLPPTPEEVDAFLSDGAPDAYERLLDRLLASSRFGERWGRHWLDVAGYVDTVGFDVDANNIILSDGKWRYRDYVIRSFNDDKPFDRFVTEQLAGDELVDWRHAQHFTPEVRDLLIATGFLRTARDETHEPESNIPLSYYGVLHDTVEIVGNILLALTINCARCHDHKFDPIPQEDYYRLMAVFTPAYNPKDWKPVFAWKSTVRDRGLPDVSPAEQAEIDRHNGAIDRQVAELNGSLAELRRPYEAKLLDAKLLAVPEPIRADTRAALATPADKRNEIQKYLAGKFAGSVQVKPEEVDAALRGPDQAAQQGLRGRIASLQGRRRSYGKIQALYDVGPPPPSYLLRRGNFASPGREVRPGFLRALCEVPERALAPADGAVASSSGRRLALARWLTASDTPASGLLARVMVNRIWQHVFGEGLVASPENFGVQGEPPTHPELLDWLATEFQRGGWRVKPLLKMLMSSTTYRQASRHDARAGPSGADPEVLDPGNRLLWRMRLRRLESEVIRDTILAVSGRLDATMGGPPVPLEAHPNGMVVVAETKQKRPADKWRRSVYLLARRAYNLSLLTVFDQPFVATNCARRDASAVPLQSLIMLNDDFLSEQAGYLADRVVRSAGDPSAGARVRRAFRLALGRDPNPAESTMCAAFLDRQAALYRKPSLPDAEVEKPALRQLCLTLFNTSEFLYAE
jgi:hypothetical protein